MSNHFLLYTSVLWRCWLGGRKGIRPVKKTEWWDAGVVMCLDQGADMHMAQLMATAAHYLLLRWIQIGFTFLVLPLWCWLTWVVLDKIQEGRKTVVCVCAFYYEIINDGRFCLQPDSLLMLLSHSLYFDGFWVTCQIVICMSYAFVHNINLCTDKLEKIYSNNYICVASYSKIVNNIFWLIAGL